jgi:hypothetical protein
MKNLKPRRGNAVNEEFLQTINVEMIGKTAMLTHLNSDIKNLLESDIATLFLDERRINNFTRGVPISSASGIPILADQSPRSSVSWTILLTACKSVLRTLAPTTPAVTLRYGDVIQCCMPVSDGRQRHYQVVCTFVDVTH